jgi:hypothetical protein
VRTSIALAVVAMTSTAFADAKRDKQMKAVQAAIAKGADAVKPFVKAFPLYVQDLQFRGGGDCEVGYGRSRYIEETEFAAFVECMKSLKLVVDGGVFVTEPGFEIGVLLDGAKLTGFTSSDQVSAARAAKRLAATANIAPDEMSLAGVSKTAPFLAVDIALCVGVDGSVESASVERYNIVDAGVWADQILATTKTIVYKPFTLAGTPIRACTHQLHVYPAAKRKAGIAELERLRKAAEDERFPDGVEGGVAGGVLCCDHDGVDGVLIAPPPPPPPAPPQNVPPTVLESNRIAGSKLIVPDDKTKAAITKSGRDKVIGSFKLCIDLNGAVQSVTTLKATGFPDYDNKLTREMRVWKYTPYLVNGKATPVCTAVTFIYAQK